MLPSKSHLQNREKNFLPNLELLRHKVEEVGYPADYNDASLDILKEILKDFDNMGIEDEKSSSEEEEEQPREEEHVINQQRHKDMIYISFLFSPYFSRKNHKSTKATFCMKKKTFEKKFKFLISLRKLKAIKLTLDEIKG